MRERKVKLLTAVGCAALLLAPISAHADLRDADFPSAPIKDGPSSNHDAWCLKEYNNCRILFRGPSMQVAGQGGILSHQYLEYRYDRLRGEHSHENLFYNYLKYRDSRGEEKTALFIFANGDAQREFARALFLWKRQLAP
jgi:hypothetical protein